MILDADLCVEPEELTKFYRAIQCGMGEFIFGERRLDPNQRNSMPVLNQWGNQFFAWAISKFVNHPIQDALCGTKVVKKKDYQSIREITQSYWPDDPFRDFTLIFGASQSGLKFCALPVAYHERTYGKSKIRPWAEGWKLVKLLFMFALARKNSLSST